MFNYSNCPACGGQEFSPFLTCEDYTVSHKKFNIVACKSCDFRFTNPIPPISELGDYYKSESYISHSNTKKGIVSQLYHLVRNYTLKKKVNLVSKYVSRGTILDYGCGTGMFLNVCQDNGWKVFGLEPDSGARDIASGMGIKGYQDKGEFLLGNPNQTFDAITLWHVLEHVTDLKETLDFFESKLNKNGVLIIAVPNYTSYDANYYKEFWAAYDVPRHLYHFEPKVISRLLSKHGFQMVKTYPMKFDSYYVSMLSEKYRTGSINYLKAFLTGLKSNLGASDTEKYSSVIYIFKHES